MQRLCIARGQHVNAIAHGVGAAASARHVQLAAWHKSERREAPGSSSLSAGRSRCATAIDRKSTTASATNREAPARTEDDRQVGRLRHARINGRGPAQSVSGNRRCHAGKVRPSDDRPPGLAKWPAWLVDRDAFSSSRGFRGKPRGWLTATRSLLVEVSGANHVVG